tara:strand:+ start:1894 stop:2682 length:789 start_codon:yes stop_codon:yes gene_type:complete
MKTKEKITQNIIIQCIFSYLLSKIILEVQFLSTFKIKVNTFSDFFIEQVGYLLATLMVIWILDWEKSTNKVLFPFKREINKRTSNKRYIIQSIMLGITLVLIFSLLTLLSLEAYSNDLQILNININNLSTFYKFINNNFIIIILLSLLFLSKRFSRVLNIMSSINIILITGSIWMKRPEIKEGLDSLKGMEIKPENILGLILILSIFILWKLIYNLWTFHIYSTNISDVSSPILNNIQKNNLISILKIYFIIGFFLLGFSSS